MSYLKATQLLPLDLLIKIQQYVDGKCIYIPKIEEQRQAWGANTSTREELRARNKQILEAYFAGQSSSTLSKKYFLSVKSIQRIIRQQMKCSSE